MLAAVSHAEMCEVYRPVFRDMTTREAQCALKVAFDEAWQRLIEILPDNELTSTERVARDEARRRVGAPAVVTVTLSPPPSPPSSTAMVQLTLF